MTTVLAAVDNSAAVGPVLATARALSTLLGAEVVAVHVVEGDNQPPSVAGLPGVKFHAVEGDPLSRLTELAAGDDVAAVVVGARRRLRSAHVGHLARALADTVDKPIVVVPPEAAPAERIGTVLLAMEGTPAKARGVKRAVELSCLAADVELIVVHVDDEESIPSFSDQVAHEAQAYAEEFLARYLHNAPRARLELRVGVASDEILDLTTSTGADLVAIGWPRTPGEEGGAVAREVLDRSHVPVLLIALT
jgi:nucleotide-binding universal stress UspA family protein